MNVMEIKALEEKRESVANQAKDIVQRALTENRANTPDESQRVNVLMEELRGIDKTLSDAEKLRGAKPRHNDSGAGGEVEERAAFAEFITGRVRELRAGEQNFSTSNNNATIPTSIAKEIVKEVKDRCPILERARVFYAKGTLKVPVYADKTGGDGKAHNIAVGYQNELTPITADAGAFTSIDLGSYLAGALSLVSNQLENNADFDVVSFVVTEMADRIALWIEGELLNGDGDTKNHCTGALSTKNSVTTKGAGAVTADDLINLQTAVKKVYQRNACWTMNAETWAEIRTLKDKNDRYLVDPSLTGGDQYVLLGKPVEISDSMPALASGNKPILYGDYSGLGVKIGRNPSVRILRELFAQQDATGVITFFEIDCKPLSKQKLAALAVA